jgi:hypothetical protein
VEDVPVREVPAIDDWSENFCLAGYDPACGVDLFIHIGRWRKDVGIWRETVAVALPDGTVAVHRAIGAANAAPDGPGGPSLKVRIIENHQRLTWEFDGAARVVETAELRTNLPSDGPKERVSFNLDFDAVAPLWDIGKAGQTTEFVGHGHTEQLGRVRGPIRVGNRHYAFDSILNRDHSRGPRVFGQNLRHIWMHGHFVNGIGFELYEAEIEEGVAAFSEVVVIDGGKLYPAKLDLGFRIPLERGLDHVSRPISFVLSYEKGKLDVEVVRYPTIIHGQATSPNEIYLGMQGVEQDGKTGWVEQSAEYLLNSEITGHGHIERLIPGQWIEES